MPETIDRRSGSDHEKERGSEEEKPAAEESSQAEAPGAESAPESPAAEAEAPPESAESIPPPGFLEMTQMLFYQAMIALGEMPNPATGKAEMDPPMAKYQISYMELLSEKTKGNLSEMEAKYLEECLHQSRLAFVAKTSAGA
jgi:hypothetical protein